jgi:hypothetical protein
VTQPALASAAAAADDRPARDASHLLHQPLHPASIDGANVAVIASMSRR